MKKVKICLFVTAFLAVFIILPNLASADTAWCHTFNVNLKIGDQNDEVTNLTSALTKEGLLQGKSDTFDEEIASTVSGFQQKYASEILTPNGLQYGTGYVGKATRAKLNKLYGCATPPGECHDFSANLKVGDSGSGVTELQNILNKEGFNIGNDSKGNFNEGTASAVTGFQQKYKDEILTPNGLQYGTGFVGKSTRAKLNKLYGCGGTPTPQPPPTIPTCNTNIMCVEGYTSYDTGERSSSGCPILKCIPLTGNRPPVIREVGGPTSLKINETGTWTVKASDPEQGILSYSVRWGDENITGLYSAAQRPWGYVQSATFTHSYDSAGNYNPTFTVTDDKGLSAKTSISVNVGETVTPSITVLSPNGGESLTAGGNYTIRWNSTNLGALNVNINLSDTTSWSMSIANNVSNSGSYAWPIPTSIIGGYFNGNQYKISITTNDCCKPTASDSSDAPFSIVAASTVTKPDLIITDLQYYAPGVIAPKVGDYVGYKVTIQNQGNKEAKGPITIKAFLNDIYLRYETYSSDFTIQPGGSFVDTQYSYTKFDKVGDNKITIQVDSDNVIDESNENNNTLNKIINVAVAIPSITVLSPNGGESLVKGTSYTIQWTGGYSIITDPTRSMALMLVKEDGTTQVGWIQFGNQPSGSYSWDPAKVRSALGYPYNVDVPDGRYKIRAIDYNSPQGTAIAYDVSDAAFSIAAAAPVSCSFSVSPQTVRYCEGGWTWAGTSQPTTGYKIKWYGTKNSVQDENGSEYPSPIDKTNFTWLAGPSANSSAIGNYTRYFKAFDSQNNVVCTSNTVNLSITDCTSACTTDSSKPAGDPPKPWWGPHPTTAQQYITVICGGTDPSSQAWCAWLTPRPQCVPLSYYTI